MNIFKIIGRWLRSLGSRGAVKQEIDEELRFHVEQRTAENIAAGMTPEAAAREARKCFGNLQSVREECRDARGASFGEVLLQDLRFGTRMLIKHPSFATTAVLMLALGIGANTAIFSVVYGLFVGPLPYDQAGELVRVDEDVEHRSAAAGVFLDWQENSTSFEGLSLVRGAQMNFTDGGEPERVTGWRVSANILKVLGVRPRLGRDFLPGDDKPGHENRVALITDSFWKRRFGGDTDIVGHTIHLDGETYVVVGVLAPRALVWSAAEVIVPVVIGIDMRAQRSTQMFGVFGRLKPGVTTRQGEAELRTITDRLRSQYPKWKSEWNAVLVPFHEAMAGHMKPTLLMLLGGVLCMLLIACINVANLLLVRATSRNKEMAIRVALGASRLRLMRQALTEGGLLSFVGGGLGILLAFWGVKLLPRLLSQFGDPADYFVWATRVHWQVLAFALILSVVTGIIFSIPSSLVASAIDANHTLKDTGPVSPGIFRSRLRNGLAISEVALSLMLLVVMGLFLKSLVGLLNVPTGYKPGNTMAMDISLSRSKYRDAMQRARFFQQLFERLAAQPRIEAVASASTMPMVSSQTAQMFVEGRKDQPAEGYQFIPLDLVRGQYFTAMGIPVQRGRGFIEADYTEGAMPVCMVSDEFVREIFPGEDPLGRRIQFWGNACEIVGIVGNTRHEALNQKRPEARVYVARLDNPPDDTESLIVRTSGDPLALAELIRKEILRIDPGQPVANVRPLKRDILRSVADTRLALQLFSVFGGLALLLAAIGLYGVMACEVSMRTKEFGIRMALGAQRADVLKGVLKKALRLTLCGIAAGIAGVLALTHVLSGQLYEVKTTDPLTLAAVALGVMAVAFLASWLPAYRATKVDPMVALRHE